MAKSKDGGPRKPDGAAAEQPSLPMPQNRDLKHYINEWQLQQKRVDKEKSALKKIEDAADEAGVSVDAIKRGIKITASPEKALQAKSDMMQLALVLEELGSPFQIQVFETKYAGPEQEAHAAGFRDGKAGRDRDYGQWMKGSPARRAYDEGYELGMIENMPVPEEAKAAERARIKAEGPRATAH